MRNLKTFALALAVMFTAVSFAVAQGPIGEYDSATGALTFKDVADLVGLRINSSTGALVGGNVTDLGGAAAGNFGVVNDQSPNFIEWGNLLGMTFDSADAGVFIESGKDQAYLDANFEFLYRTSADPGTDQTGTLRGGDVIPEPTSVALIGLGLMGLVAARRRNG